MASYNYEEIILSRECQVILVPSGERVTLPGGSKITVMQSLGSSYTVMTEDGYMARVSGKEVEALGKEIAVEVVGTQMKPNFPLPLEPRQLEELIWDELRACYDPEIPVNIVDLGLVYYCGVIPLSEGGNKAEIKFTLTAPGCGMGDILKMDIEDRVACVPGITKVNVEVVVDPPWDPSRMSQAAQLELGFF